MKRALKTLLLWLLISLLPIQGMAAVMATGPITSASQTCHTALERHGAHCPSNDADAAATQHQPCSACAACCVGASAPPSAASPVAGHRMSESGFMAPGLPGGSFIPAALERPPKFFFA